MRNDYSTTKYDRPITGYVYENVVLNGLSDAYDNDYDLVGKYVIYTDNEGFVYSTRYKTKQEAESSFYDVTV